ncbi:hypothetical protein FA15DRAFT_60231 [Coprinopsis marcescibilis]|uniref:Uncharacterized protein n=1 Tax=Coprinopsis marcescibilis TaxID=230819 RepID=A0A5C3L792_COPMA|nr:hypothetical protein FA15DRAFT_60231 [Coprinopsis marcescibilis]
MSDFSPVEDSSDQVPPLPEDLEESIDILGELVDTLGLQDVSFASFSSALNRLMDRSFALSLTQQRLSSTEEQIMDHLAYLKHQNGLLEHWMKVLQEDPSFDGASGSSEKPEALERRREALLRKAREYHNDLESILAHSQVPPVTINRMLRKQEKNRQLESEIKIKRAKIKAFQGLPPNLDLARLQLRKAREEQLELIRLREELLQNMAAGVA